MPREDSANLNSAETLDSEEIQFFLFARTPERGKIELNRFEQEEVAATTFSRWGARAPRRTKGRGEAKVALAKFESRPQLYGSLCCSLGCCIPSITVLFSAPQQIARQMDRKVSGARKTICRPPSLKSLSCWPFSND